jgi:hypothetical protein
MIYPPNIFSEASTSLSAMTERLTSTKKYRHAGLAGFFPAGYEHVLIHL